MKARAIVPISRWRRVTPFRHSWFTKPADLIPDRFPVPRIHAWKCSIIEIFRLLIRMRVTKKHKEKILECSKRLVNQGRSHSDGLSVQGNT